MDAMRSSAGPCAKGRVASEPGAHNPGLGAPGLAAVAWDRVASPLLANANVDLDFEGIGFAIIGLLAGS